MRASGGMEPPSAAGVLSLLWHVALVGMFVINRLDYAALRDGTPASHRSLLGGADDSLSSPKLLNPRECSYADGVQHHSASCSIANGSDRIIGRLADLKLNTRPNMRSPEISGSPRTGISAKI